MFHFLPTADTGSVGRDAADSKALIVLFTNNT
jgi:hypothetical protein